jgi:NDP-sugar pyrophosphorylase family protein
MADLSQIDRVKRSTSEPPRAAVVLAAGRGTRMKDLTAETPKPMLVVAGRPLLEWIVEALRDAGIARFVVVTGYRPERIEDHFGDGSRLGVEMRYRRQTVQDGTARALLLGRDDVGSEPFLLAWGDILTERSNYPALVRRFSDTGCDAMLAVNEVDDPWRGAAVYFDGERRIERIVEKPPKGTATTRWNNAGIAAFRPVVFDYAERVAPSVRGEYELPDALSKMVADGRDVRAFELAGRWSDVGTPEDLARADAWLSERR